MGEKRSEVKETSHGYLSVRFPLFKPRNGCFRILKEISSILLFYTKTSWEEHGIFHIFLMRRHRLTSAKVLRLHCTSVEKSGKTATILFPKGILPLSLLRQRIVSLKLRGGGALSGSGLPDIRCACSTTNVGENASLPYGSHSSFSRNVGGLPLPSPLGGR